VLLRAIKVHVMRTTSFEVLEKRSEAASKLSSDRKSLSAITIPSALLRTSELDDDGNDCVDGGPGSCEGINEAWDDGNGAG
jgi:hypothetical protein